MLLHHTHTHFATERWKVKTKMLTSGNLYFLSFFFAYWWFLLCTCNACIKEQNVLQALLYDRLGTVHLSTSPRSLCTSARVWVFKVSEQLFSPLSCSSSVSQSKKKKIVIEPLVWGQGQRRHVVPFLFTGAGGSGREVFIDTFCSADHGPDLSDSPLWLLLLKSPS